jgi:hypothetical protein
MPDVSPKPAIDWKSEAIAFGRALFIAAAVFLAARFGVKIDPQVFVVAADGTPVVASKSHALPACDACPCDKCPTPCPPCTRK